MLHLVERFLTHFTYVALILVLCAAGTGVPIPEDIPLIFSGYLCSDFSPIHNVATAITGESDHDGVRERAATQPMRHRPHRGIMIVAGMIGVLMGDSMIFTIGRRGMNSDGLVARHIRRVLHSKRRERVERHFSRHGNWTVFVGRFLPGARAIVFSMAGMSGMSYLRFLAIDGAAALVSVPLFVLCGYYFAENIDHVFGVIDRVKHILLPCAVVIVLGGLLLHAVRRRRLLREAAERSGSDKRVA